MTGARVCCALWFAEGCERLIGRGLVVVIWLLRPVLGKRKSVLACQYCQVWFHLFPQDLFSSRDYDVVPPGTLIGDSLGSGIMLKMSNGMWKDMTDNEGLLVPGSCLCQCGPHHVYGWGETWA